MLFFHHKTNAKISINWKVLYIFEHLIDKKFNCLIWVMRKIFLVFITLWLIIPAIHAQKVGLVLSGGGAKGMTRIGRKQHPY